MTAPGKWRAGLFALAMVAPAWAQETPVAKAVPVEQSPAAEAPATLLIGADAALKPALLELAQLWADARPEAKLDLELTNAATLERVINEGRPYDVVLLPGVTLADRLSEKGLLVPGKRRLVARDVLAVLGKAPGGEILSVRKLPDYLEGPWKRLALGDPQLTSSGPHAQALLRKLGLDESKALEKEVVPMMEQALALMRNGKVDAVMGWRSQLGSQRRPGEALLVVGGEKDYAQFYVAARTANAEHPKPAQAFMDFLVSESALPVWEKWSLGGK